MPHDPRGNPEQPGEGPLMPLPWVRLDTQWPQNPKFLMLAEDKRWRAVAAYMAGLAYSGAHGMKGFIPTLALPLCHATKKEAQELVDVGLWIAQRGGWDINGWSEFQPETDDAEARRDKAKKAAAARWHRKEGSVIDMHEHHA